MHSVDFEGTAVKPSKIFCVGKNYLAHIEEMNSAIPSQMVVFMKPNSCIHDQLVAYRGEPVHYEGEICLLMRNNTVAGVGFGLDLTKRETQSQLKKEGLPWERSKAFSGSALFSDFVSAPRSLDDLTLELWVDDEMRQRGGVALMMHRPAAIIEELLTFSEIADNDIIMTGTPSGVGKVEAGARFEGRLLDGEVEITRMAWVAH